MLMNVYREEEIQEVFSGARISCIVGAAGDVIEDIQSVADMV